MGPLCSTADTEKLLSATAVMRAIMQIAGIGRRATTLLQGAVITAEGLGVRQETLCKTVWDLARFGSIKCLNL